MRKLCWLVTAMVTSGTATYLVVKRLKQDQVRRRREESAKLFDQTEEPPFDDLERLFDNVEEFHEEPWL